MIEGSIFILFEHAVLNNIINKESLVNVLDVQQNNINAYQRNTNIF